MKKRAGCSRNSVPARKQAHLAPVPPVFFEGSPLSFFFLLCPAPLLCPPPFPPQCCPAGLPCWVPCPGASSPSLVCVCVRSRGALSLHASRPKKKKNKRWRAPFQTLWAAPRPARPAPPATPPDRGGHVTPGGRGRGGPNRRGPGSGHWAGGSAMRRTLPDARTCAREMRRPPLLPSPPLAHGRQPPPAGPLPAHPTGDLVSRLMEASMKAWGREADRAAPGRRGTGPPSLSVGLSNRKKKKNNNQK